MSIASRITAITGHITDIYDTLELGGDTTENKNIVNINTEIKREYKNFLANGVDTLWNNWEKVSGSGETLSLTPTIKGKMKIDLKGNTQQNGTPTPDTPIPVQVVSGDNTIKVEGKNLLNVANKSGSLSSQYYQDYETGYTLEVGKTYTLSLNANVSVTPFLLSVGAGEAGYVRSIYTEGGKQNGRISITFTPTSADLENATKLFIRCPRYNSATTTTYTLSDIMLEKGSTATTYEPYISQSYPVSLGNIELCKIGTYQDSIVKDNGKWYLHKEIGKVVLDGSETWGQTGTARPNTLLYYSNVIDSIKLNINNPPLYCNYFTNGETWVTDVERIQLVANNYGLRIRISNILAPNSTALKTWLGNNNTTLFFPLATPTYEEITDTTLLSQLEALAYSYEGTTNISQENNDLASELDITALKEMS